MDNFDKKKEIAFSEKRKEPLNAEKRKEIVNLIINDKKKLTMLILAILGIVLILLSLPSEKSEAAAESGTLEEYKRKLEDELAELCSSVEGAGRCKVSVSFSEGAKSEYRGTNKISETPPRVQGVTIVAEGGSNPKVKSALTECITAMFDIKANRVAVLEMK